MRSYDLFVAKPGSAVFSECGRYRYRLTRSVGPGDRRACFVMLNPSTADHQVNDRTITRCIGFAQSWNCGELMVVNLFAFKSTDPLGMFAADDPVGPKNHDHVLSAASVAHVSGGPVVAAWGVLGYHRDQDRKVAALLTETLSIPLKCLGTTVEGYPRHPLYRKGETPLEPFTFRSINRS